MDINDAGRSGAGEPYILALGDSLTAGYGLRAEDAFAAQLEQRLRRTLPIATMLNAGVSGDTHPPSIDAWVEHWRAARASQ